MITGANAAVTNAMNTVRTNLNLNSSGGTTSWIPSWWILTLAAILLIGVSLALVYKDEIAAWWRKNVQKEPVEAPPPPPANPEDHATLPENPLDASRIVEKVLPGGNKQVFAVSSNKYTYYDAEPLCRALGAELATYDQVKEAWNRGADWCNYGWVKGQMAVYPTNKDTYDKLQKGPAEQAGACGKPGVNGGFFDNPELRFGVTCFGPKPAQSQNDETKITAGIPMSPDALEIDKKIQQFKRETDSIGILPFNTNSWSN